MSAPQYNRTSSVHADGSRPKIRIADVSGKFTRLKPWVFSALLVFLLVLPWLHIQGERLFLLYIERRQFNFFGMSFNAQDMYLVFFLVTGLAFSLFFITALFGRIWCGWSCPQTVFLEGVYRKIERWVEGSREEQIRLEKAPWTGTKIFKKIVKHGLYVLISLLIAATVVLCFVPQTYYVDLWMQGLSTHPITLTWIVLISFLAYGNFAWFREQVCVILCPYGRLQSALTDDDTLVIGYDTKRGEPRGKSSSPGKGDCVDCGRCVAVCPTGIDIRAGLQMECVGCANCIDACDTIMAKMKRPTGLIRYDSYHGFQGQRSRIMRPRIYMYIGLLILGVVVSSFTISQRTSFEANLLRLPGPPFIVDGDEVRNQFEVHLFNKSNRALTLHLDASSSENLDFIFPFREVTLAPRTDQRVPWFARQKVNSFKGPVTVLFKVVSGAPKSQLSREVTFLGP